MSPKWEAEVGGCGRPCEAEVGGRRSPRCEAAGVQGGRTKWEAQVGGPSGRQWEAEVGGRVRPKWEALVGGRWSPRPWEALVGGPSERPKREAKVRGYVRLWEAEG